MKTSRLLPVFPTILAISTAVLSTTALSSDIWEDSDTLNDKMNAKMMRFMAKQRALEANMSKEELEALQESHGGCGSVDIGNVQGGQSKDVETVVIIKGDVINANNKCK